MRIQMSPRVKSTSAPPPLEDELLRTSGLENDWLSETVHGDADSFFDGMVAEIGEARESIELEMYIFDDDDLGRRLASSLASAARRGVRVRVLVDGVGSPDWPGARGAILADADIETRVYHPLPWSIDGLTRIRTSLGVVGALFRGMNRRDHKKVCVLDRRAAWLGSMNISDRSLRSVNGAKAWHECGVRVEGGEVPVILGAFEYVWDRALNPFARFANRFKHRRRVAAFRAARLVRVNMPAEIRREKLGELLRRIRSARRRVWIETPYFVPTPRLAYALTHAAAAGADVKLILPLRPDIFFMPWILSGVLSRLTRRAFRVFEYTPTTLHAKMMIVDDWATIGSSNLNYRSIVHDLELDVVIVSPSARADLERRFLSDLEQSVEVNEEFLSNEPLLSRIMGRLFMPLRYWM